MEQSPLTVSDQTIETTGLQIQESRSNDWLVLRENGSTEARYYLSKPISVNGGWSKRYLGNRAKAEIQDILGKLATNRIAELHTESRHVRYALLTGESAQAIVEESHEGEKLLWIQSIPGRTQQQTCELLFELFAFCFAESKAKDLPSWREQQFTTTKTTYDYRKSDWGIKQARVDFNSCDGCMQCVVNCPDASLMVDQDGDFVGVDRDHCTGCRYCEEVCPIRQIDLDGARSLIPSYVSKIGLNHTRVELVGEPLKELANLLEGKAFNQFGDFHAHHSYSGAGVLQVELIHKNAANDAVPLVLTFLKNGNSAWYKALLREKRTILAYGLGELELRIVKELQKEGYSILGGVSREKFKELQSLPAAEWERADGKKSEFVGLGLFLEKSLMEMLDSGAVDVVVTGESSWLRAADKRAIMQKTGCGLWAISPHNILETRDKILDTVMERIYEDIQNHSPELWYKWIGRAGHATSMFARVMQGLRGLKEKVHHALVPGHRLCPACPQPKIVENVCRTAALVAGREGKVVKRLIIANTGCLTASGMSNIYGTTFRDPAGRILFGNAAAVASGIEAGLNYLRRMERLDPEEKFEVIVFTGDGGDADIGLQTLLGAVERGHKLRYFVFNNEAYMNTGGQRSGATSFGARTKSTVPGDMAPGKMQSRKVVADLVAQHPDTLVIETNPDEESHFLRSLEMSFQHDGFVYCNFSSTCHTGQGYLGEQARSVSVTRIHTGMSPLVVRKDARTHLEIPPQLQNQNLETSLLNWLTKLDVVRNYTDPCGERLFIGEGTLTDKKNKLTINPRYKALDLLKYFQPVTESMRLEGRFSHLVDPASGKIRDGKEPIVYINQLDILIRLLALFKNSSEYGDLYSRKEYQELIQVMIELRTEQRKKWAEKEAALARVKKERKPGKEQRIFMNEERRKNNAARVGKDVLNIEWFGFAGWGVQSAAHLASDILHLLGLHPLDWPSFGPERAGAPVEAYNKASGRPLSDRSTIKQSQVAMVFDENHLEEPNHKARILKTLVKDGILFLNTPLSPKEARARFGIAGKSIITADLSKTAWEKLGDRRRVSIAALGALTRALELKGLEADVDKVREIIRLAAKKHTDANLSAFDITYFKAQAEGLAEKYQLPQDTKRAEPSPLDWEVSTGNEAVAHAVLQSNYGVYAGYPITPSTTVGEYLSELKAKGLIDTEVVLTESEYAAMSALVGSAAAGTLSFTATDSQGLLLMHEVLPVAAGLGLPIIMYIANRAISRKELSIYPDHSDSMAELTTGWVQLYAKNNQELYDFMIIAPVLWKYLRAPIMINGDGFNLSHTRELVTFLDDARVARFQQEVEELLGNVWKGTMNPGSSPATYMEGAVAQDRRLSADIAYPKILQVLQEYAECSGRSYKPLMEYGAQEASIALVAQGSVVSTIEKAIETTQTRSVKVLDVKVMIPFPYEPVASQIAGCETVVVMDRSTSPGLYPPLLKETACADNLHNSGKRTNIYGEIYGLGGRNPQPEDILEIIRKAVLIGTPIRENHLLASAQVKAMELTGEATEKPIASDRAEEIADLLLELSYLHIADMKLDQNPFSSPAEEKLELIRYLNQELIHPLQTGDSVRFMRPVGHAGVREGIEDERNKRLRVLELFTL